jgi:putative solute:sodium symporter small subunit
MSSTSRRIFWSRTLQLTAVLMGFWLFINLGVPWFARSLDGLRGFGFPAGYWLAAEGMLLLYLAIIVIYAVRMDRLEARLLHSEAAQTSASATGADPQ